MNALMSVTEDSFDVLARDCIERCTALVRHILDRGDTLPAFVANLLTDWERGVRSGLPESAARQVIGFTPLPGTYSDICLGITLLRTRSPTYLPVAEEAINRAAERFTRARPGSADAAADDRQFVAAAHESAAAVGRRRSR